MVTPPSSYPVLLGDIPTSSTASAAFTIDFASCDREARFTLSAPWSSSVYHTGTFESWMHFRRDHDWDSKK